MTISSRVLLTFSVSKRSPYNCLKWIYSIMQTIAMNYFCRL